jgi:hypothetical protein
MEAVMPLADPFDFFSPPPRPLRVTHDAIEFHRARAHELRAAFYAEAWRDLWRAMRRFSCWFRRPSVDVALRGGCD